MIIYRWHASRSKTPRSMINYQPRLRVRCHAKVADAVGRTRAGRACRCSFGPGEAQALQPLPSTAGTTREELSPRTLTTRKNSKEQHTTKYSVEAEKGEETPTHTLLSLFANTTVLERLTLHSAKFERDPGIPGDRSQAPARVRCSTGTEPQE